MNLKRMAFTAAFVLTISGTLYSCGPKDADILKSVQTQLASTPGVTATIEKGVVTLSGEFANDATKAQIDAAIKSIKGVKSLTDNTTVTPPPPPPVINPDQEIINTIQSAITAAGFSTVKVNVANGEVTLTGDAKRADLQKIMAAANESHPKRVINKLTLK